MKTHGDRMARCDRTQSFAYCALSLLLIFLFSSFTRFQQNSNAILFALCVYSLVLTELTLSNPVQQTHNMRIRPLLANRQPQPAKPQHVSTTVPSLKFNSVIVSTNGAFGSVSMINQHAISHKQKKATETKPKGEWRRVKAITPSPLQLCILSTTEAGPAASGVRANTLFTSHNWGSK
jgi:hypothetical protein